ncbi:hypothetical protein R0I01_14800 [Bacillus pumilus]|nr:hypothetical protein R0I01_14800 [Bacillus pumilus]
MTLSINSRQDVKDALGLLSLSKSSSQTFEIGLLWMTWNPTIASMKGKGFRSSRPQRNHGVNPSLMSLILNGHFMICDATPIFFKGSESVWRKHAFIAGVCSMIVICSAAIILQHHEWIGWISGGISIIGVMMSGLLMGA